MEKKNPFDPQYIRSKIIDIKEGWIKHQEFFVGTEWLDGVLPSSRSMKEKEYRFFYNDLISEE